MLALAVSIPSYATESREEIEIFEDSVYTVGTSKSYLTNSSTSMNAAEAI